MQLLDSVRFAGLLIAGILLTGCATSPEPQLAEAWMEDVLNYEASLGSDHPDSMENLFKVSPEIRSEVINKFGRMPDYLAARRMANWLVSKKGKAMTYDIEANLQPLEAYSQNRGNCLSFTLLLIQLASELGIELHANEVDLPDFWSENEERDLILYRHVNAIYQSDRHKQVFDLAIDEYSEGYPQRLVSRRQAAALLFSNIGIQKLQSGDSEQALHYLKLAVSMNPKSSDIWVNLAAALKRSAHPIRAEQAYLYAIALDDRGSVAASNLERLYRAQGRESQADKFKKLALRARRKNPYIHFRKAQTAFKNQNYLSAKKSIRRAINLHNEDPQFYAFRSLLRQVDENYLGAVRDLEKAHNMSTSLEDRGRYASKVDRVVAHVKEQAELQRKQNKRRDRFGNVRLEIPDSY